MMDTRPDYYAILETRSDATRSEIEAAYDRLARRYQPDPQGEPLDAERMRLINEAFDTLDDPILRAAYHRERGLPEPPYEPATARDQKPITDRKTMGAIAIMLAGAGALIAAIVLAVIAILDEEQGYVTLESGLKYRDTTEGTGPFPQEGQTVSVHYVGMLEDGTVFDSSGDGPPFSFVLGQGRVIEGWEEGISTMRIGSTRELIIPPELAYGEDGSGPIPPNETLKFEVILLGATD